MMSMEMNEQTPVSSSDSHMEKQKTMMFSEKGDNSSRDSVSTDSCDSPLHKRPRRPLAFTTLEELQKINGKDIHMEDYVDWFVSLGSQVDEEDILLPRNYCQWFSTLGTQAKADVLHPYLYIDWYAKKFNAAAPMVFPDESDVIKEYGQLALEYYNNINKCDYEYVRDVAIRDCGDSSHVNFYGRLKVSPSKPEPEPPQVLFFADVDLLDTVEECCILDPDEFGDAPGLHLPENYCAECNGVEHQSARCE